MEKCVYKESGAIIAAMLGDIELAALILALGNIVAATILGIAFVVGAGRIKK